MANRHGFCSLMGHECKGEDGFAGILFGFGGCFNRSVWFNEFPLMGWWTQMVFGSNGVCCV